MNITEKDLETLKEICMYLSRQKGIIPKEYAKYLAKLLTNIKK
jgi:hypothetical protein